MRSHLQLVISLDDQQLQVIEDGGCIRTFGVSTALNGAGCEIHSYRTPTGRFRIAGKIGDGAPSGTIFKQRLPVGLWQSQHVTEEDLILTRILQLDGLDAANANTLERCIYLHGTNREDMLGRPESHGCVRLSNADIIELFDRVRVGDLVEILPSKQQADG